MNAIEPGRRRGCGRHLARLDLCPAWDRSTRYGTRVSAKAPTLVDTLTPVDSSAWDQSKR